MNRTTPANDALWIGVDVGGTKVAVLVVDPRGAVLSQAVFPTLLDDPDHTLTGIINAVRSTLEEADARMEDVASIGFGIPGRVDPETGIVYSAVNLNWSKVAAGEVLQRELGAPCFLENDVRMAALGVQRLPGYAKAQNLAYVSVGTGIAAGLILGGRLYRGTHGMAGEIGHMIVAPNGPLCKCGIHGCLEALASGPTIARKGYQAVASGVDTILRHMQPITAKSVYEAARLGDATALAIAKEAGFYLGQALQQIVMAYDVEHVILGGGVARAGKPFLEPVLKELKRQGQESPLAREMLPIEMFHLLPPDYDAGLWGGIALAEQGLSANHL